MRTKWTYKALDEFGRTRLSKNFYMREFLHSEIAQFHRLLNAPDNPELAIRTGAKLCTEVLEPLAEAWGKIHIRSGYRSAEVNRLGNLRKLNCASNKLNAAAHIWDELDENQLAGATACIVLPRYQDYYERTGDWTSLAWWIHTHIPAYFEMCFFNLQCALNIRWYEGAHVGKSIKTFVTNRDTGNKRNLITAGIISDDYSEMRIRESVRKATAIINSSR